MLDLFICLLPCFTSFSWCYLLFVRRGRGQSRYILAWLALFAGINFLLDAYLFTPFGDFRRIAVIETLYLFITPSVFSMIILVIEKIEGRNLSTMAITLLFTPGLLLGSSGLILYMTLGIDDSAAYLEAFNTAGGHPWGWTDNIYYLRDFVSIHLYRGTLSALIAASGLCCIGYFKKKQFHFKEVWDFFVHGKPVETSHFIAFSIINVIILIIARMIMGRQIISDSMPIRWTMAILMTVSIFNGFFTGFRFDGGKVDLPHFRNPGLFEEEMKTYIEVQRRKSEAAAGMIRNEDSLMRLRDVFVEHMDIDRPYLDPELTLDDVASYLSTNRTYLSAMLKNVMGTSFKAYINNKRIQEVQRELTQNTEDSISEIAERTGFASDSQLIKKFNEIVGETPRSWARKQSIDRGGGK